MQTAAAEGGGGGVCVVLSCVSQERGSCVSCVVYRAYRLSHACSCLHAARRRTRCGGLGAQSSRAAEAEPAPRTPQHTTSSSTAENRYSKTRHSACNDRMLRTAHRTLCALRRSLTTDLRTLLAALVCVRAVRHRASLSSASLYRHVPREPTHGPCGCHAIACAQLPRRPVLVRTAGRRHRRRILHARCGRIVCIGRRQRHAQGVRKTVQHKSGKRGAHAIRRQPALHTPRRRLPHRASLAASPSIYTRWSPRQRHHLHRRTPPRQLRYLAANQSRTQTKFQHPIALPRPSRVLHADRLWKGSHRTVKDRSAQGTNA